MKTVTTMFLLLVAGIFNLHAAAGNRVLELGDGVQLEFIRVKAGSFGMGSPPSESNRREEERRFEVTLTQDFWLGRTEVTQAQWLAVMDNNPSYFKGDDLPVDTVSWQEAMEFCGLLTERERAAGRLPEGYVYTLPTEAQWEYACRAGTTGAYAGSLPEMAWYGQNSGDHTHPVGTKQANAWGFHDMHGNVWEWVRDRYGDYPQGRVTDPRSPVAGVDRVMRGGSWVSDARACRSSERLHTFESYSHVMLGFRVAMSPASKDRMLELEGGVELELIWVKEGSFTMGNPVWESLKRHDERPFEVTLTKGFWLGRTEVTQAQWQAVMGNNPSHFKGANLPVDRVSWGAAMEFCRLLTEREREEGRLPEGYVYTLPTEAQWEYACRAGTTGAYAGSLPEMAWYNQNSGDRTHPVATKQANAWGFHDMHGNVREWVLDGFWNYPAGKAMDPRVPPASKESDRIMRGGSWKHEAAYCWSSRRDRLGLLASLRRDHETDGFRVVLSAAQ